MHIDVFAPGVVPAWFLPRGITLKNPVSFGDWSKSLWRSILAASLGFSIIAAPRPGWGDDILTQRSNNLRTGATTSAGLNQTTVRDFQLLATLGVDGPVLAQPLFVQSVNFRGTLRSMVWIATAKNNIYAFNADPPFEQLGSAIHLDAPYEPNRADLALVGAALLTCLPEDPACQHPIIGIESTPVIDRDSGTMFVGYRRNARLAGEQRLAAIDIRTGQKRSDVAVPGSDVWHKLHRNRASLLLDHKVVFLGFAAVNEGKREGDYGKSYQGWVHAFDADTLFHLGSYRTVRDPGNRGDPLDDGLDGGGLWQGSTGLTADGKG